jgi:hypothetical protein
MPACAALATSVLYALAAARGGTQLRPTACRGPSPPDTARRLGSRSEAVAISAVLGVLMLLQHTGQIRQGAGYD